MAELILYACPVGPLADAIEAYWAEVLASIGRNSAHDYMPHVTLTGFFHDDDASVEHHVATLAQLVSASPSPRGDVRVDGSMFEPNHHLLVVEAPWCRALAEAFRERTPGVRAKDQLHLSLAYGFPPHEAASLERLGRRLVEASLPTAWELRFYERLTPGVWRAHAAWPL